MAAASLAKLIRAFNHHPHGLAAVEPVWAIATLSEWAPLSNPKILDALVEFYAIHRQFEYVKELLLAGRCAASILTFRPIFKHANNESKIEFFHLLKNSFSQLVPDRHIFARTIDACIAQARWGDLLAAVEGVYLQKIGLDPILKGKLFAVADAGNTQLATLLDMIQRQQIEDTSIV